jgi:hypothetical protein
MTKLTQSGSDGSSNYQAGRDLVFNNSGISPSEAMKIAQEVFNLNFPALANEAAILATRRAQSLIASLIQKLAEMGAPLDSFKDPDVQYSLLAAQRDYARSGKEDLQHLLVNLLVSRCSINNTELQQIVLSEAIETARKLTHGQVATLTLSWIVNRVRTTSIVDLPTLKDFTEANLVPLLTDIATSTIDFEHIYYTGCGSLGVESIPVESAFFSYYPGLFQVGLTEEQIPERVAKPPFGMPLFMSCLNDPNRLRVNAVTSAQAVELAIENGIEVPSDYANLLTIDSTATRVAKILSDVHAGWSTLMEKWNSSPLSRFDLSSVGIAIAHGYWSSLPTAEDVPLSIWIPASSSQELVT